MTPETAIDLNDTVGSIAAHIADAGRLFRKYNIDYGCGGDVKLGDAAARVGLEPSCLARELAALNRVPPDAPADDAALIAHIVERYHGAHRREIPPLIELARRVEKTHSQHPAVPAGLASQLEQLLCDLLDHMQKEEQVLFPAMTSGHRGSLSVPITVMRFEHDQHAHGIRALQRLLGGCAPPADGCGSWRALHAGVGKLINDLIEHMHLENNVLFPRFEA
jgi:regulator of cell morphogenesis and NO signaling